MKPAPHILLSSYLVKRAADPQIDPRLLAALVGGGGGALAGGGIQALRKMFQSKRDEEENGPPSILNGMLLGGLGGAGLGASMQHMGMQNAQPEAPSKLPTLRGAVKDPEAPSIKIPAQVNGLTGIPGAPVLGMPPRLTRTGLPVQPPSIPAGALTLQNGSMPQEQMLSQLLRGELAPGIKNPGLQQRITERANTIKDLGVGALNAIPNAHKALRESEQAELEVKAMLEKQREGNGPSIFR